MFQDSWFADTVREVYVSERKYVDIAVRMRQELIQLSRERGTEITDIMIIKKALKLQRKTGMPYGTILFSYKKLIENRASGLSDDENAWHNVALCF